MFAVRSIQQYPGFCIHSHRKGFKLRICFKLISILTLIIILLLALSEPKVQNAFSLIPTA